MPTVWVVRGSSIRGKLFKKMTEVHEVLNNMTHVSQ